MSRHYSPARKYLQARPSSQKKDGTPDGDHINNPPVILIETVLEDEHAGH